MKAAIKVESDLQARLRGIVERMDAIHNDHGPLDIDAAVRKVAFDLSYVAGILQLHLNTGER